MQYLIYTTIVSSAVAAQTFPHRHNKLRGDGKINNNDGCDGFNGIVGYRGAIFHFVQSPFKFSPDKDSSSIEWIIDGALMINCKKGVIQDKGEYSIMKKTYKSARFIDKRGNNPHPNILMPGMFDLHNHFPQTPGGMADYGADLLVWLEQYIFKLERRFSKGCDRYIMPPNGTYPGKVNQTCVAIRK